MTIEQILRIESLLVGKRIEKILFDRGLGLVPAWFTIVLSDEKHQMFYLEIEANFRILGPSEIILSFEDLFLDHFMNEISRRKYQSQKSIEKTYLEIALKRANELFSKKRISRAKLYQFGDLELICRKVGRFHIINDTHENEASVIRFLKVVEDNNCETVFEVKLSKGAPVLIEPK